eukprot:1188512-Alexandrium_andersonii.AAC.1
MEDSTPTVYNMVKVAPLQVDRSVQRKDKARRGLGIGSDPLFYRMTADETGCSEWDAKQGRRGDTEPENRSYRVTIYEKDGRIWICLLYTSDAADDM